MKINQLKKIKYVFFAALLLSTSTFAQLICELEPRDRFFSKYVTVDPSGSAFADNSGLAYHPTENILIITLDKLINIPLDPAPEEGLNYITRHIMGYNLLKDEAFPIHISNFDVFMSLENSDFEGLTHLKENYFVLLEENENKIYFLKYVPGKYEFEVLSAHLTGIPFVNGDGLQGVSYDPHTERLYLVRDVDERLFSVSLTLPGPNSIGDIVEYTAQQIADGTNSVKVSSSITNANGLFHLGQIYPANHILANNILVISQSSKVLIDIDIMLNQNNDLDSGSLIQKKFQKFEDVSSPQGIEPKPGGVVVVGNVIYICSEKDLTTGNDGGISRYILKSVNDCCKTQVTLLKNSFTESGTFLNNLYESSQSIVTEITNDVGVDVIIRECEAVDLKSNHITLNAGFKVEAGACLNAEIKPCE